MKKKSNTLTNNDGPFLCAAFFACAKCHAPILCAAQLDQEIDWEEHLFQEVGCTACGWKANNQAGRKAVQKLTLKWGVIKRELGLRASGQ
jgi:Zn ribbon nucleic-acid-binding protein